MPGGVTHLARTLCLGPAGADQFLVVAIRHKADFLAVRLVVNFEPEVGRDPPDLGLVGDLADGEQAAREVGPLDAEEHVGLVLCAVE